MSWDGINRRIEPPHVVVDVDKQKDEPVPAVIYEDARYKFGKRIAYLAGALIILTLQVLQYQDYKDLEQKVDRLTVLVEERNER